MTESQPIPMVLFCPRCAYQHLDRPQPEKGWENPPHRSHECQFCGYVWRPADVATVGVEKLETRGQSDQDPSPSGAHANDPSVVRRVWRQYAACAMIGTFSREDSASMQSDFWRVGIAAEAADSMLEEERKRFGGPVR